MFSHFTLGSNDLARGQAFYSELMPTIGQELLWENLEFGLVKYGFADGRYPSLFICKPYDERAASAGNGFHIAFHADSHEAVDRFYKTAIALGGQCEGKPGLRVHYGDDYYAAYVRDLDGNKLQVVYYERSRSTAATGDVISHITLGYDDFVQSAAFYRATFSALGIVELREEGDDESIGFGCQHKALPVVYIQPTFDGNSPSHGNGTHTAFAASDRYAVDLWYAEAIANGGSCDGPPGIRPDYSPDYYGAYVRDPMGNKLQAVFRG